MVVAPKQAQRPMMVQARDQVVCSWVQAVMSQAAMRQASGQASGQASDGWKSMRQARGQAVHR